MKPNSDTTAKLYIGFDVHKEKTSIAIAEPGATGEIRSYGEVATTQIALERTLRKIAKARGLALADIHVWQRRLVRGYKTLDRQRAHHQ